MITTEYLQELKRKAYATGNGAVIHDLIGMISGAEAYLKMFNRNDENKESNYVWMMWCITKINYYLIENKFPKNPTEKLWYQSKLPPNMPWFDSEKYQKEAKELCNPS